MLLPRYPNVSELSVDGELSHTTNESQWMSIVAISTLRTLTVESSLFRDADIDRPTECYFQCRQISTLCFNMVSKRFDSTGFGPYIFDRLLEFCHELLTIEVTGDLWGSKIKWRCSVETIKLELDDSVLGVGDIFGSLRGLGSLKTLMFTIPESVESQEYLSLWNHIISVPETCPSLETLGIYNYVTRNDESDDESHQSDDESYESDDESYESDDESYDTPERGPRGLAPGLVKTNWRGLLWEFAIGNGFIDLTVRYGWTGYSDIADASG